MRRTNLLRKALFGGVLLSLLLGGAATARAQAPATTPGAQPPVPMNDSGAILCFIRAAGAEISSESHSPPSETGCGLGL